MGSVDLCSEGSLAPMTTTLGCFGFCEPCCIVRDLVGAFWLDVAVQEFVDFILPFLGGSPTLTLPLMFCEHSRVPSKCDFCPSVVAVAGNALGLQPICSLLLGFSSVRFYVQTSFLLPFVSRVR